MAVQQKGLVYRFSKGKGYKQDRVLEIDALFWASYTLQQNRWGCTMPFEQ